MSDFEKLLGQLNAISAQSSNDKADMAKSLGAEGGEPEGGEPTGTDANAPKDDNEPKAGEGQKADNEPKGGVIAKSATIDGEQFDVVEVDELVKSIHDLGDRFDAREDSLAKALTATLETITNQGKMIKSLQDRVTSLSREGAGRRTMLTVHEKPAAGEQQTMAKSQQEEEHLTTGDFLAKSEAAWEGKAISGLEYNTIDACMRSGQMPSADLQKKVLGYKPAGN